MTGFTPAPNRGGYVDLAAPGVDVIAPAPGGGIEFSSGTSFSAALISGVVALMLESDPLTSPEELTTRLLEAARDLGSTGRDEIFGAGLVDALQGVRGQASD